VFGLSISAQPGFHSGLVGGVADGLQAVVARAREAAEGLQLRQLGGIQRSQAVGLAVHQSAFFLAHDVQQGLPGRAFHRQPGGQGRAGGWIIWRHGAFP